MDVKDFEDYKIPLVIGVTGHRDIDPNNATLRDNIKNELCKLQTDYPNTPFIIMSPLAEGADRLLVNLARECLNNPRLCVPLPLPDAMYKQDFVTFESKEEFDELLDSADYIKDIELPDANNIDESQPETGDIQGELRNQQYAKVGAYVAEHSQILFAIWDGQPSKGTGGTAEVVDWAKHRRIPEQYSTLPVDELYEPLVANLVIQINPKEPKVLYLNKPDEQMESFNAYQQLDRFNLNAADFQRNHHEKCQESKAYLLGNEAKQPLFQSKELHWLLTIYGVADAMAIYYQGKNRHIWHLIYLLFATAIIFFGVIDLCPNLVLVYLILFAVMWSCYRLLKKRNYEERFLDYRSLAEGLRVQIFWQLNKLQNRVSANYLRKHRGVLSWIRFSLANTEKISLLHKPANIKPSTKALDITQKLWIENQKQYFADKQKILQPRIKGLNWVQRISFYMMLIVASVYGFLLILNSSCQELINIENIFQLLSVLCPQKLGDINNYFQALIGFFGAISLIAETYKTRETLEEIQKQYALLAPLFEKASEQIQQEIRPPDEILLDLGKEALQENGEWLWWHRQHPDEPPKG